MKTQKTEFKVDEIQKFGNTNFGRISSFKDLLDKYKDYAPTIGQRRVKLGFPSIDNYLRLTQSDNVLIVAKTSGKKTTLSRNIALANAELLKDELIVIFSLELLEEDEAELYLSMIMDIPTESVEKKFASKDPEFIEKAYEKSDKYGNIVTITDTVDIADIIPFILYIEHLTGKRIAFCIVDYGQLVEDAEHRDEMRAAASVAKKFKKINTAIKKQFIITSQVGREAGKSKDGLDVNSARGSGNWENSAQVVLSLEMPDPMDIRKDKDTKQPIFPFGEHQAEVCDLINENHHLEFHTLTIRKKKKYYLGKKKPTCIIQYNATNLRMTEFVPKQRPPILDNNEPF